ncbi:hypothetical protein TNCV_2418081 [Trichonephila clavipes]|nr:hypothetical protein TNCV_2418081 [Trichonephila clavipes]
MPQTDLSHLAMFADDTAIITQNKRFSVVISNLQHYVSLLELWLTDWKIKVNASKSACLMFTRKWPVTTSGLTPVKFFGVPVPGETSRTADCHTPPIASAVRNVIDLAVFKHIPFNHSVRVINDLSSDHYPVILEINLNTSIIENPEQLSTNWFNFKFALNKKPLPTVELSSNDNIELAISELNQNFTEAFVEASKPKFNNARKSSPEIKFKIYQRNRLRKFWQRTRCPSIYSQFRTLSREIAKDIQNIPAYSGKSTLRLYRPLTTLFGGNPLYYVSLFNPFPLKGALGNIAITPIEKAEVIADSLQVQSSNPTTSLVENFSTNATR